MKLSAEYEAEQKELTEQVKADREMVNAYEQGKADFDSFAAVIRKYVGITELTPTIVNEFVKRLSSMRRTSPAATGGRKSRLSGTSSGN